MGSLPAVTSDEQGARRRTKALAMPVVLEKPGGHARYSSSYVLRGHYGEDLGVTVWCEAGDRLPLVVLAAEHEEPISFVAVDGPLATVQAA
jgi:hypothetical protein